jgi:hypothetical protein
MNIPVTLPAPTTAPFIHALDEKGKRELFAAMIMQGMCANQFWDDTPWDDIADHAVNAADDLISKLSTKKP